MLGKTPQEKFLRTHFSQRPYHVRSGSEFLKNFRSLNRSGQKRIAEDFHELFPGFVDVHFRKSADNEDGKWHFDAEDTFVIQSAGAQYVRLKSDVHANVITYCRLNVGDWLYIPAGYLHRAEALPHSAHVSVEILI